jgi:hypothetical protein
MRISPFRFILSRLLAVSVTIAATLLPQSTHAQLSYPPSLFDELNRTSVSPNTRKVIVLVHGWTAKAPTDPTVTGSYVYAQSDPQDNRGSYADWPWAAVYADLVTPPKKAELLANGWAVVCYHWEKDASTGGVFSNGRFVEEAPQAAASHAVDHGANDGGYKSRGLGPLLYYSTLDGTGSSTLREVHFIAHSAGAWVAREAMRTLMQANPYVVCQLTLLDPYTPPVVIDGKDLSAAQMGAISSSNIVDQTRIHRLENYYAVDGEGLDSCCDPTELGGDCPTLNTQHVFSWNTTRDINCRVDFSTIGPLFASYYCYHSGPIMFYDDILYSSSFQPPRDGINNRTFSDSVTNQVFGDYIRKSLIIKAYCIRMEMVLFVQRSRLSQVSQAILCRLPSARQ